MYSLPVPGNLLKGMAWDIILSASSRNNLIDFSSCNFPLLHYFSDVPSDFLREPQEADASQATSMAVGLLGAAVCGFMRSMPLEAPQLKTQVVDLSGPPSETWSW